jgi:enoyl-CoA hydratase
MLVELETRGAVAVLTLNRPDALNALSPQMFADLDARLDELAADPEVRAVVLTGAGEKAFCAGADIKHMATASPADAREWASYGQRVLDRLEAFPKPVIAAVNGYALGGGCELALACDVRMASENARFGQLEVNLGIIPAWGGTQRLGRLTSPGFAKDLILSGRMAGADEARANGLATHVHPLADLVDKAVELAETIASRAPAAVAAAKELCNMALDGDIGHGMARERDAFALLFSTDDQREGMAAFVEKRPARFTGS